MTVHRMTGGRLPPEEHSGQGTAHLQLVEKLFPPRNTLRSRTIDSAFRYFAAPVVLIAEALAITVLLDQFGSPAGYRKIPLIFITTHSDEEEWAQALRDGAVAFLYKSFSFPDLRDAIDAALSQSFR